MTDESAKGLLIAHLLEHSIKHGDFTLKSGKKSPYFLDSKQTACDPDGVVLMTDVALEHIPSDATAIGGITVGADPVAYGIAAVAATHGRRLRSFTIRKEAKDHGVVGRVAGALREALHFFRHDREAATGGPRRSAPAPRRAAPDPRTPR